MRNCTDSSLHVHAYDGKDTAEVTPASKAEFSTENRGETHELHCAGEGVGHCKMRVVVNAGPEVDECVAVAGGTHDSKGEAEFHLDSGSLADVLRYEVVKNETGGHTDSRSRSAS